MDKKHTLIAWHSKKHGIKVLENCLKHLAEKEIIVSTVIYLYQDEKDVSKINVNQKLDKIQLEINKPSEHRPIYDLLKKKLLPIIRKTADQNTAFHINISPGTPAMHAVWLLLFSGGAFPPGTRLWSSQKSNETEKTWIDEVNFKINTYLSEIRRNSYIQPGTARYDAEYKSKRLVDMLEQLRLYSSIPNTPFLITGERGTGKTRLVETIVKDIKGKEVITVACGTLLPELAASELFGHTKGAFTGAIEDSSGYLKNAANKILFLDEIQDLPKNVQRMLVRFLQDPMRKYRKVGITDKEESSNAEIVCASHLSLQELRNCIDSDFFDRIALLFFEVPPLRENREDFESIWASVWKEMNTSAEIKNEISKVPWDNRIKNVLFNSNLPGNLRDVQRFALLIMVFQNTSGDPIDQAIDRWQEMQKEIETSDSKKQPDNKIDLDIPWDEQLNDLRKKMAETAYKKCGNNSKKAAEKLKTDPKTIRNYLEKLKLSTLSSQ